MPTESTRPSPKDENHPARTKDDRPPTPAPALPDGPGAVVAGWAGGAGGGATASPGRGRLSPGGPPRSDADAHVPCPPPAEAGAVRRSAGGVAPVPGGADAGPQVPCPAPGLAVVAATGGPSPAVPAEAGAVPPATGCAAGAAAHIPAAPDGPGAAPVSGRVGRGRSSPGGPEGRAVVQPPAPDRADGGRPSPGGPPRPDTDARVPRPAPGGAAGPELPVPAPRGYLDLFRVREFRAVFAAHLLSLLGVVVTEISLTFLVYELTGSPLLSALTFALGFLPYLFGGTLLAGVADRFPARRVLVVCDLVCAGCVAVMVVPGTPVAGLLALRCAVAAVAPVFTGTRMAALTDILGEGDLYVLGRSLLRIVSQSAVLTGFAVGGVLLAVVPPRGAISLTVVTFLCSAALLRFGTKDRPARLLKKDGGANLLRDSLDGARLVFADRRIRALTLLFWVPAMFVVAPEALMAPYADRIGAGPATLGLLMCAMPVGHIGAELFAGSALSPRSRSRIVLPSAAVGLLPLLVYAVTPGVTLALVALVLSGAGAVYVIGLDQWFVDALPDELRGRAMTLMTAGLMTVQGLGMALAGLAAEFLPVHQVVAGAGAIGTVCSVVLVYEVRRTGAGNPGVGAPRQMTSR